jgi:hypothetical protein
MKFLRSAVSHPTRLTSTGNYVEPCDYKGYGGQVCPHVHVCTRMYTLYTYVHVYTTLAT